MYISINNHFQYSTTEIEKFIKTKNFHFSRPHPATEIRHHFMILNGLLFCWRRSNDVIFSVIGESNESIIWHCIMTISTYDMEESQQIHSKAFKVIQNESRISSFFPVTMKMLGFCPNSIFPSKMGETSPPSILPMEFPFSNGVSV